MSVPYLFIGFVVGYSLFLLVVYLGFYVFFQYKTKRICRKYWQVLDSSTEAEVCLLFTTPADSFTANVWVANTTLGILLKKYPGKVWSLKPPCESLFEGKLFFVLFWEQDEPEFFAISDSELINRLPVMSSDFALSHFDESRAAAFQDMVTKLEEKLGTRN